MGSQPSSFRADLPFVEHFAHADDREGEVRQRGEVAGCAQRTLLVHHGQHVLVEHVDEALQGAQLYAGMAIGEGLRLQQEHELHNLRTHGVTGAAGVGHHQVVLQLAQVLPGNGDIVQGAETGGDAIYGTADVFHLPVQVFAALYNGLGGLFGKDQFLVFVQNFFYSLQGEMFT